MNSAQTFASSESDDPLGRIRRVTLLYNVVDRLSFGEKQDVLADEDTVATVEKIYETLTRENFIVNLFELNEKTIDSLFEHKTDLIFNLCYGIGSLPRTEAEVVRVLEKTGMAFTGARHKAILLTTDKGLTKKIFSDNNIPTPAAQIFVSAKDPLDHNLQFPLIVKPKSQDCSLGIHNDAVVADKKSLEKRLDYLLSTYNEPVLVEQYIEGRELNLTLLGNGEKVEMLPVSEIVFGESYQDGQKWKIVDFEAKWIEKSSNFSQTKGICPAPLEDGLYRKLEQWAVLAYKKCGCRDYARIDIRLAPNNTPYFLEVNLNPGIGPDDGLVRSARAAGFTYAGFLKRIMRETVLRTATSGFAAMKFV